MNMDPHIGEIHGCYKIIGDTNKRASDGKKIYLCKCLECGGEFEHRRSAIVDRKTNKCTHYITYGNVKIKIGDASIKNQRIKKVFSGMMNRCYNSNRQDYKYYGGRGITVCQEWIDNPILFEKWSYNNGYNDNLTIDRIDENMGYCPENCRWITQEENARFKGKTNYITATVTLSGKQWGSLIHDHSINYINTMVKKIGIEKTREYIEQRFSNKHDLLKTQ